MDYARWLRTAMHEAGHALVALVLDLNPIEAKLESDLYGVVYVEPDRPDTAVGKATRARKLGAFHVAGNLSSAGNSEFGWLVDLRNRVVPHDDVYRPLQVIDESPTDALHASDLACADEERLRIAVCRAAGPDHVAGFTG